MENKLTKGQLSWLIVLRIFIGWHFLYEGMIKVLNPNWTAMTYLIDSKGLARCLLTWPGMQD
jgi:thiosulfate dehydrogenase [quinone] large subunit